MKKSLALGFLAISVATLLASCTSSTDVKSMPRGGALQKYDNAQPIEGVESDGHTLIYWKWK